MDPLSGLSNILVSCTLCVLFGFYIFKPTQFNLRCCYAFQVALLFDTLVAQWLLHPYAQQGASLDHSPATVVLIHEPWVRLVAGLDTWKLNTQMPGQNDVVNQPRECGVYGFRALGPVQVAQFI